MAKKVHAKQKRYFGSATHLKLVRFKSRKRATRAKTFASESAAKSWAEKQGIKSFELVNLRGEFSKEKKLKVVAK
ncbi:MAG TPA: hypothetical protein HA362_07915 [Nanoarchaeota archaeon]|nr:hypothetical protein [Nanoarchaeota archaeon]